MIDLLLFCAGAIVTAITIVIIATLVKLIIFVIKQ